MLVKSFTVVHRFSKVTLSQWWILTRVVAVKWTGVWHSRWFTSSSAGSWQHHDTGRTSSGCRRRVVNRQACRPPRSTTSSGCRRRRCYPWRQLHQVWFAAVYFCISFDLPRQQWSLLNCFCTEQGHCGACRRKWRLTDTDLCPCGETQTISHIAESCPLTKLNGSLSRLHSADEDAVSWVTSYGSRHAYEKMTSAKQTLLSEQRRVNEGKEGRTGVGWRTWKTVWACRLTQ